MRPWRCDSTLESHLDPPDPFIVPSSFDSTVIQQSCFVHSQQPWEMIDSVYTQCLGADVGWIVHLHQSEAPLFHCFLTPECFVSRCLRYSTRPDPRLVILPRAAAEPLRTRNGSGQPISVRNCCSWIPHAAARVAVYNSASPLKGEMTPCVVELVSSTDCRSLITTQELLLRSVSFAAQSLSAYTSRYSSLVPAGNDHARCGLCTRYRTTRRARASVPHVARVISRMRFVSGCCTSGLSVARFPNTQTRLRNQDFCSSLTGSSPLRCRESFHSRACYTFRSRTVQVTHVDSLFGLSRISRPREATFVFHPAYRAFEQVPSLSLPGPTIAKPLVSKWLRSVVSSLPNQIQRCFHKEVVTVTRPRDYVAGVVQRSWKHFALSLPVAAQGL